MNNESNPYRCLANGFRANKKSRRLDEEFLIKRLNNYLIFFLIKNSTVINKNNSNEVDSTLLLTRSMQCKLWLGIYASSCNKQQQVSDI